MKMTAGERLGLLVIFVLVPLNLAFQAWVSALAVMCVGLIIMWLSVTRDLARLRYEHALREEEPRPQFGTRLHEQMEAWVHQDEDEPTS